MKNKVKLNTDNYFICERLREIDISYFVLYNLITKKYEVHSSQQIDNSYCFTVPYKVLDARTIDYALKTRIENKDKLIAEIDRQNMLLEKEIVKNEIDTLKEVLLWKFQML